MDRDIPVFNRPIMDKIFKKNQQKHLERLRNIKSGSSNRTMPIQQNHALSNKKALLVQQQKRTQIEKQNVLLFNKMMRIMKRNDPNNQPNFGQQWRSTKSGSENSRIVQQNRFILQRIEHQKPTISNKKLQEERVKNLTILRFLGKYPNPSASRTGYDTSSSQVGRKSESKRKYDSYNRGDLQQFSFENQMSDQQFKNYQDQVRRVQEKDIENSNRKRKQMSQTAQKKYFSKKIDSEGSEGVSKLANIDINNNIGIKQQKIYFRQGTKPIQRLNDVEDKTHFSNTPFSKQIVLFQKKGEINKKPADITFVRFSNFYKIKALFEEPINGLVAYQLEIPEEEGNQFFEQCNYDYNRICRMLIIEEGCLVVNPSLEKQQAESQGNYEIQKGVKKQENNKKLFVNSKSQKEIGQDEKNWARYQEALEQSIQ